MLERREEEYSCFIISSSSPAGCCHQTRLHLGAAATTAGPLSTSYAHSVERWWTSRLERGLNHRRVSSSTKTTQPPAGRAAEAAGRRESLQGQREGPGQAGEAGPTHEGRWRGSIRRAGSSKNNGTSLVQGPNTTKLISSGPN